MENKDYQTALDNLLKAKIIYEKISQYKDTLEAVIYNEKVTQIDTLIRLCAFNLKKGDDEKAIEKMMQNYPEKTKIEDTIQKVKYETKREQIEKIEEIHFNNKAIPLKTEKLKMVFKKVESHQQLI